MQLISGRRFQHSYLAQFTVITPAGSSLPRYQCSHPHHISTAIPPIIWLAQPANKPGAYLHDQSRFSWALIKQITDECHLYDPQSCYQSFQDYHRAER